MAHAHLDVWVHFRGASLAPRDLRICEVSVLFLGRGADSEQFATSVIQFDSLLWKFSSFEPSALADWFDGGCRSGMLAGV